LLAFECSPLFGSHALIVRGDRKPLRQLMISEDDVRPLACLGGGERIATQQEVAAFPSSADWSRVHLWLFRNPSLHLKPTRLDDGTELHTSGLI
jgi:hypothetical protein